jgi:glyoxylase-like metal-dependent hydrolase (beta-lactamase superfamily II)
MKRAWVLSAIVALGGLSVATSALQAPPPGPTAAALAATKIEKVKDNLYVITGSGAEDQNAFSGGNTAVFITAGGVVIVDTKLPGWGQTILDRIKTVTDKPITTIINTHTHGDHTGSNAFFGMNVESIVHENTKANMAKMDDFKGDKAAFLPKKTYKDKLTVGTGRDQIDLYYFGPGHTNGDTFVVFPALRTMHAGDMFAWKALPFIDVSNGGSAVGHPQTLAKVISTIKNVDTVITGHTPLMKWSDLGEYADFSKDFVAWAQAEMKSGKSVDQAAAEYKVPAKYRGYTAGVGSFGGAKGNTQAVYDELKK